MADITGRNTEGYIEPSGKVNWRGDQTIAPQPQSIYKTSSIPFADLGARKVVGDRVFRYARAGDAVSKAMLVQMSTDDGILSLQQGVTAGGSAITGAKTLTLFASTALTENYFAEGYVHVESGSAEGSMYRIKSHSSIGGATNGTFYLYDVISESFGILDIVTMVPNMYQRVGLCSGTANMMCVGASPVAATTNDYFWLQTWGPAPIKLSAGRPLKGYQAFVGLTGAVQLGAAATEMSIGVGMYDCTASDTGLVFLQIAP